MNRIERSQAVIAGRPADRTPTYLPGIACDVASELLGRKVSTGTGSLHYAEAAVWMKGQAAHDEWAQKHYEDLADLYRALDIDIFRMPWRMYERPARQLDEYTFVYGDPDGAHSIWRYSPESGDYGAVQIVRPSEADDLEARTRKSVQVQNEQIAAGALDKFDVSTEYKRICRLYGQEFFAIFSGGGGMDVGMDAESLMLLACEPDLVAQRVMISARWAVAIGKALQRNGLPGVILAGGDMAGTSGPFYSPQCFRKVMLPALKYAMGELAKAGAHYVFRSDGSLWPVADMLFSEAACPGFGEVDRDAGMNSAKLRERYPKLVLWGCMSVAKLPRQSAAEVREEAGKIIGESGGMGYFHGPSNAVMKGTPARNVEAMFAVR